MINYDLPKSVFVGGAEYPIRNDGDYRVILDIISALNDAELDTSGKAAVALIIFYGENNIPDDKQEAIAQMMRFINLGADEKNDEQKKPALMDWEQDFPLLIPPINKTLGFEVRAVPYLHWWTFCGGYQEMDGENTFSTVVRIRKKRQKGERLDKGEERFFVENRDLVVLKKSLSQNDIDFLFGDD